jgi:phosphatidylglycerophosphatase A
MKKQFVTFVATGAWSGLIPWVPGTFGTIPAWLIAFFFIKGSILWMIAAAVVTLFISVWAAGEAEKQFGHDARKIVIDEWAGMFVALIFVPFSLTNYMIAFVAFRFFDVVKLPPASQWEKLPGGWGVTMDDIAAGVHANIVTQVIALVIRMYFTG